MRKIIIIPICLMILSIIMAEMGIIFELLFKFLFTVSLIVFFSIHVKKFTRYKELYIYLLIGCLVGDSLLVTEKYVTNETLKFFLFAGGMIAYLAAYYPLAIFYIRKGKWSWLTTIVSIVMVTFSYFIFRQLHNLPKEMIIPVMLYLGQALLMVIGSTTLINQLEKSQALRFVAVAVLFFISDSLIGINLFRHNFRFAELAVYLTYGIALLIAFKAFSQFKAEDSRPIYFKKEKKEDQKTDK